MPLPTKDRRHARWMLAYTAGFAACFLACYAGMLLSGCAPIWRVDGLMQHYPFFAYIGQWLRDALNALFTGGSVRAFDFSLGFGEDVLVSMNYYGLGDPLTAVCALAFGANAEAGFCALIVLRLWCAGAACIALARDRGLAWKSALYAGLTYAFGLWIFTEAALRQAMFLNPAIHFPLMILGLERVFARRKPWILSLAVLLAALGGFYFLYCSSAMLLVYALIRQFTRGEEHPWRTLPATAGRAIGWYLLGLGLSAAVFLPVAMGFLGGQRLGNVFTLSEMRLHYSLRDYLRFPLALVSARNLGAVPFVPALTAFGAALLVIRRRREDRSWRWLTAVTAVALLVPATGWALNGFSYETTRWSYAPALLTSMIGGKMLPELGRLTRREKCALGALGALALAYLAGISFSSLAGSRLTVAVAFAAVAATMLVLALRLQAKTEFARRACAAALALVVLGNVAATYARAWSNRGGDEMLLGESAEIAQSSPWADLSETDGFSRTDADVSATEEMINGAALEGEAGTSVYNSIISASTHNLMRDVNSAGLLQINAITGLDGRAALEAVWSVGRYVLDPAQSSRVPYGFTYAGTTAQGEEVYENEWALPIGYAMTGVVAQSEYDALTPLEKQWALLQGAVLDEAPEGVSEIEPELSVLELDGVEVQMENIQSDGEMLTVGEDARITLSFDAPADCELYVELEGFAFQDGLIDLGNRVYFSSGGIDTDILLMPSGFELDLLDRGGYLVNLGYSSEGRTTAEITFARTGVYRLSGIRMYAQPMEAFDSLVGALQARGIQDAVVEDGFVSGSISLAEPAVMVFSIPYSEGWTAKVDGAPVETLASAGSLLAVSLGAGSHEIELHYETPWLRAGCAISAVSACLLVAALIVGRRKHKGVQP